MKIYVQLQIVNEIFYILHCVSLFQSQALSIQFIFYSSIFLRKLFLASFSSHCCCRSILPLYKCSNVHFFPLLHHELALAFFLLLLWWWKFINWLCYFCRVFSLILPWSEPTWKLFSSSDSTTVTRQFFQIIKTYLNYLKFIMKNCGQKWVCGGVIDSNKKLPQLNYET